MGNPKKRPRLPVKYGYRTPVIVLLLLAGIVYWALEIRKPSSYAVCLQGFNHTERWISEYRVNGQWGGNIPPKEPGARYGGGGGFSCGSQIGGRTVTVKWEYSLARTEDYERGVKPETHEVTLPMPKAESNHSRYFQVHIYPDHHVELELSDDSLPDRKYR
jgi:hypothetical protein